jgi:ubiquinone/menaquinone biosynthesis C-methylase UbiE
MRAYSFNKKWSGIKDKQGAKIDESSIYVNVGQKPVTQRQLNLYYYFLFIKNIIAKQNAKDILEVGAGRGTISLYLAEYLHLNLSLLDNVADAMTIAKKKFTEHGQSAEFYVDNALGSNLASQSFDSIVSIGLAEHFKEDEVKNLFQEQFRLLRSGGVMISFNIPGKFSIQFLNTIMRFFRKIFGSYSESIKKDYYRNSLRPSDFKKLAKEAGFEKMEIVNACPFPIFTPLKLTNDKKITKIYKVILRIRSLFIKYPYKTNYLVSQGHFLVAYKK